ncbi:YitT family protein [Actinoallomurus sp. NBC_01490]
MARHDSAELNIVVRLLMVVAGLALNGVGIGALIQAGLGLGAWDVLHQGLSDHTGLSFGVVVILVTVAALIPWWPLRERPGVGTILNVFIAGIVIDWVLDWTSPAHALWLRISLMIAGVAIFALGQGMYLAPRLGAGAREGLMTGINRKFGISIRLSRFLIEASVLVLGIILGGSIGLGTVVFTVAIGPSVQLAMRICGYRERTTGDEVTRPVAAGAPGR